MALPDSNIHHHLKLTAVQRDNLVELMQHLVRFSALLRRNQLLVFSADEALRAPLPPDQVIAGRRMPPMMPLAHGPLAGVPPRPYESWSDYGARAFCMPFGSSLEAWLQRPHWAQTDPTPLGAALRIVHALEHGVPGNWDRVSSGADLSDYPYSGHALDALGLQGWREGVGAEEWEAEWPQIQQVALPKARLR